MLAVGVRGHTAGGSGGRQRGEARRALLLSCAEHEARRESLLVEGVHLSISHVVQLMSHHPSVLPFLVHIKSETKHVERMAVRAKYMTLVRA